MKHQFIFCERMWFTGHAPFCTADVDECEESGGSDCGQLCTNVPGSFTCSCREGFRLHPDGKTCIGEYHGSRVTKQGNTQVCLQPGINVPVIEQALGTLLLPTSDDAKPSNRSSADCLEETMLMYFLLCCWTLSVSSSCIRCATPQTWLSARRGTVGVSSCAGRLAAPSPATAGSGSRSRPTGGPAKVSAERGGAGRGGWRGAGWCGHVRASSSVL